jgi:BlaI family transcriptional regulator, penicillinase repressor
MARPPSTQPTDGEMEILKVLWKTGPAELGQVRAELQKQRPVALTTVATMLKVMLGKKLVKRSDGPRGYLWSARVSRAAAARSLVRKLLDHAFDGSAQRLVAHLLQEGGLNERDRDEIRRLLEAHDAGTEPNAAERGGRSKR